MKLWDPKLYVVEIWWEHASAGEWLFEDAFTTRKEALKRKDQLRASGYKFRIVKYRRCEPV